MLSNSFCILMNCILHKEKKVHTIWIYLIHLERYWYWHGTVHQLTYSGRSCLCILSMNIEFWPIPNLRKPDSNLNCNPIFDKFHKWRIKMKRKQQRNSFWLRPLFLLKGDPVYVDVFNYQFCIICVWGYVQCRLKIKRLKEHNYQWSRSYH